MKIDKAIIGGMEVKIEDLREIIILKDEAIRQKEGDIITLQRKVKKISESLPDHISKELHRINQEVYKEILVERLNIELKQKNDEMIDKLVSMLKNIGFSEIVLNKFYSKDLTGAFVEIVKWIKGAMKIETDLIERITNLRDHLEKCLKEIWGV